jgi:hypothetical protein
MTASSGVPAIALVTAEKGRASKPSNVLLRSMSAPHTIARPSNAATSWQEARECAPIGARSDSDRLCRSQKGKSDCANACQLPVRFRQALRCPRITLLYSFRLGSFAAYRFDRSRSKICTWAPLFTLAVHSPRARRQGRECQGHRPGRSVAPVASVVAERRRTAVCMSSSAGHRGTALGPSVARSSRRS